MRATWTLTLNRIGTVLMPLNGTPAQADLVITLMARLRLFKSPQEVPEMRARILRNPRENVQAYIDALNDRLGYAPGISPASDKQRMFIGDLEKTIYRTKKTKPTDLLTYADADAKIKFLLQAKAEMKKANLSLAPVTDISTRKAV